MHVRIIFSCMNRLIRSIAGSLIPLCLPAMAMAAEHSFPDVPSNHPVFAAAEYLRTNGILQGYEDGTFRPDQAVNRAEVMKIIVLQRSPAESMATVTQSGSSFRDVPADAWYAPYVEQAYLGLRAIDGPPATYTFDPTRTVTRAEFLKMLLLAYEVDPGSSYGELTFPFGTDVQSAEEWYYPYMRYAFTASMLDTRGGALRPGGELTRGDIADMLYRFLLYGQGKRVQTLLSVTENETLTALRLMESGEIDGAERAAGRAILASRGALTSQPDDATVKSGVKTAEAVMALVRAARSGMEGDAIKTIDRGTTSWLLGEKAKEFSASFDPIIRQIQESATKIVEEARKK